MLKLIKISIPLMLLLFISCDKGDNTENTKDVEYYTHLRNTSWINIDNDGFVDKITFDTYKADMAFISPRNFINGYYMCSTIQYVIENNMVYIVGYEPELMVNSTIKSFSIKEIDNSKMITDDGISEMEYYKVSNNIKMNVISSNVLNLSEIIGQEQVVEYIVSDPSVLEISKSPSYKIVAKAHGKSFVYLKTTNSEKVLEVDVTGSIIEQCDYYYKSIYLHSSKVEQYFGTPDNVNSDFVIYKHGNNTVMLTPDSYGFIEGVLLYYDCEPSEMKTYLDKEYVYYPEYDLYAGSNLFVVMHDQSEKLVVYFPIEE